MPWRKVSIFLIFNKVELFPSQGEAVAPQKVLNGIQTGRPRRQNEDKNDETTKTFYHISRPDGLGAGRNGNGLGSDLDGSDHVWDI